jgi:hypothetical protein
MPVSTSLNRSGEGTIQVHKEPEADGMRLREPNRGFALKDDEIFLMFSATGTPGNSPARKLAAHYLFNRQYLQFTALDGKQGQRQ